MYKLAISTSGEYVSAAIFEEKLLASFVSKTNKGSTGILLNQINELFDKTKASRNDLNALYLVLLHQEQAYIRNKQTHFV